MRPDEMRLVHLLDGVHHVALLVDEGGELLEDLVDIRDVTLQLLDGALPLLERPQVHVLLHLRLGGGGRGLGLGRERVPHLKHRLPLLPLLLLVDGRGRGGGNGSGVGAGPLDGVLLLLGGGSLGGLEVVEDGHEVVRQPLRLQLQRPLLPIRPLALPHSDGTGEGEEDERRPRCCRRP